MEKFQDSSSKIYNKFYLNKLRLFILDLELKNKKFEVELKVWTDELDYLSEEFADYKL
jgi:hypothetical protein